MSWGIASLKASTQAVVKIRIDEKRHADFALAHRTRKGDSVEGRGLLCVRHSRCEDKDQSDSVACPSASTASVQPAPPKI
jgi:hypothetical protein